MQIQPWAEVYFNLFSAEDGFIRDVTFGGGLWTSFQSERTLATEDPQWFYEADYYPLLTIGFAGGVSLTTIYYWYDSPNGAWDDAVQELNFKLAWDDSEALGRWSMKPWVNLAIETHIHLVRLAGLRGQGVQLGIGPTLYAAEDESFTLTVPAEMASPSTTTTSPRAAARTPSATARSACSRACRSASCPRAPARGRSASARTTCSSAARSRATTRGRSTYPVGTASLAVAF